MRHSSGITSDQIRDIHISLLKATLQAEALIKGLSPDSVLYETISRLIENTEAVIFNPLYDINDYLFDNVIPYEPIDEEYEIKLPSKIK